MKTAAVLRNRFTRVVPQNEEFQFKGMITEAGIVLLEPRMRRGNWIEVSKILTGFDRINRLKLFPLLKGQEPVVTDLKCPAKFQEQLEE